MDSYIVLTFKGEELPKQYINCVVKKFKNNLRYSNDYFRLIDKASYNQAYERYIYRLLTQHDCFVRLAVLSDERDIVLGFSVNQPNCLHYIFVDKDQRRKGIATSLVREPIKEFTHITKIGLMLWPLKLSDAKFNPFKELI